MSPGELVQCHLNSELDNLIKRLRDFNKIYKVRGVGKIISCRVPLFQSITGSVGVTEP